MNAWLAVIRVIHILASAGLLGAMGYSIAVVQPRARRFFQEARDFEEFTAFISHGVRWKMIGTLGLIALTGALLIICHPHEADHGWIALIAAKIVVLLIATLVFCYASWRLWPARIFASPEEIPGFQRRFRLVGYTMITLVVLEFVLAAVAHG